MSEANRAFAFQWKLVNVINLKDQTCLCTATITLGVYTSQMARISNHFSWF